MRKLLSAAIVASAAYPAFLFPFPVRPVFKLPPVARRVHPLDHEICHSNVDENKD
jgi:hypothetical protein